MRLAVLLLLTLPAVSLAQQIAIGEYMLPTNSSPYGITAGPDGAMWFTENYTATVGRIEQSGAVTQYRTSTGPSAPYGIAAGPDGALWFADYAGNAIGRITTSGVVTEYPVPVPNALPMGIAAGPDGRMWFTMSSDSNEVIGAITTAGAFTFYQAPGNYTNSITAGSDGALWYTCPSCEIGRITTLGVYSYYDLPSQDAGLGAITAGSDGALWFTESTANQIGRITTSGAITSYPVPTANSGLMGITAGPDGALWFAESAVKQIGRITTSGTVTEYPIPAASYSLPDQIAAGPDGTLWFTDSYARIGEVFFVTANLAVSPPGGYYTSQLTFAGSGYAPDENVRIYYQGVGSNVLASATADATGSFTATAQAPQSPYGPRLFLGVGQTSGKLGAANFSMAPHLVLSPNSGPPGMIVTVEGYGFGSFEDVRVYWKGLASLGLVVTNAAGTFNGSTAFTFTVPSDAQPGANEVVGHVPAEPLGVGIFTVQ